MSAVARTPCDENVIANRDQPGDGAPRDPAVGRWTLIATILASSIVFIDSSVVNVALPTLQRDLDATAAQAQWVVESYALFLAALILVGGSLGDHLGRKRVFLWGTALFALTSVWCGLATDANMLIVARAAQGIAGALLTPASLALISATFTDETERGRAIGTWSGFTAITSAGGPVIGGFLVETASWRWVFFLNLPLAAVVLFVGARWVQESRDPEESRIDWLGAALVTVGLGALVFALIEAPRYGWGDPLVLGPLLVGLAALAAFVVVESRVAAPMLPLGLFRSRTFSGVNLLTLFLYGAFGGALFYLPFNLVQVQGYGSTAGAAMLPAILILFGLSRYTGALAGKVGPRLPLVVGPAIVAVAMLLFARPGIGGSYWTTYFPAAVVLGLGMAITVPTLTTTVMNAVAARQAGTASGVNNAVARTAQLLAIAVFGLGVAGVFDGALASELDDVPGLPPEARATIVDRQGDLAAITLPEGLAPETASAARNAINVAFIDGFRLAMILGALMALAAAVSAALLVSGKTTPSPRTQDEPSPRNDPSTQDRDRAPAPSPGVTAE